MNVKRGSVVSHTVAKDWGIGKVMEIDGERATIRFNDGMIRKIIASHFADLKPADPASYLPPVPTPPPVPKIRTARAALKKTKKVKPVAV